MEPETTLIKQEEIWSTKTFWEKLKSYFLGGLLVGLPLTLTIYLIVWIIQTVDHWVEPLFPETFSFIENNIPGYGLIIALITITFLGVLSKGLGGKYVFKYGEKFVSKLPFVRSLYGTIKQVSQAFLDQESASFRAVALIEYPRKDVWSLCFVTGKTDGEVKHHLKNSKMVNVFIPTTPNPTSGFLLFIEEKEIIYLNMKVDEGIKMIISAGVITPPYKITK